MFAAVASLFLMLPFSVSTPVSAAAGEVLILDSTVAGGAGSTLAQKFVLAGKTPVVVNAATWSAMTAAQFASYDAIVLGDPACQFLGPEAPATANAGVWSSVVDGNVVVIGTDETLHQTSGGTQLMEKAAAFTVAQAGKTGAYISLSCYYHGTAPGTPVPLLSGFGTFTATGVGCFNDAHIVATHPALTGLTDATLSNWGCSVHEGFDSWPVSFEVLAIAEGIGAAFTASDGTVGTPYILARGVEVISDIDLTPGTATNDLGTSHTVTATVTTDDPVAGTPVVGKTVTFTVVAGPHTTTTGTGVTNAAGVATFTYTGMAVGTDTIEAAFVDALGRTQRSNRVEKIWVAVEICGNGIDDDGDGAIDEGCNKPPVCSAAAASPGLIWPPNHKMVAIAVTGLTDPDGDPLTVTVTSIRQDEPTNTVGDGNTEVDGSGVGTSTAMVRAERTGTPKVPGNGRVYHIGFTASDGKGGTCTGVVRVGVPHDQGGRSVPVDGGPLYDSTTP
ncbi:MAG: hypothetical protein ACR2MO_07220 [Acidimicrobiales bacterium]